MDEERKREDHVAYDGPIFGDEMTKFTKEQFDKMLERIAESTRCEGRLFPKTKEVMK